MSSVALSRATCKSVAESFCCVEQEHNKKNNDKLYNKFFIR